MQWNALMLQTITISGHLTQAYAMQTSSRAYCLGKNASIITNSADALYELDGVGSNLIIIKGKIHGGTADQDSAVTLDNGHSTVQIGKSGRIEASTGIEMGGAGQLLENHGVIRAHDRGAWLQSDGEIQNYGLLYGNNDGLVSGGANGVKVANHSGGRIVSDITAVTISGSSYTESTLENDGLIKGKSWAFFSSWGEETVTNHGVMKGMISMGDGNDTFDNRDGKVDHAISGQLGNDTLYTDDAKVLLSENVGEGNDTVYSTVSYKLSANVENLLLIGRSNTNGTGTDTANTLLGNRADNFVKGLAGTDVLNGGRGDDHLVGGVDGDVFIFNAHSGNDVITDFIAGEDHISLAGQHVIDDYFDMLNNYVRTEHGNVVIHIGAHDSIILEDVKVKDLQETDFSF